MNQNFSSLSKRALSVSQQTPQPYSYIDDKFPEYIQVTRTQGVITGNRVSFNAHTFDPNTFLRSRAYIKLGVEIRRVEIETNTGVETPVAFQDEDVIRRKPGMNLMNSMVEQKLRINNNAITQRNGRYWSRNIVTQHCGKNINDTYLSGSGSSYSNHTEVTDEQGTVLNGLSDSDIQKQIDRAARDIEDGQTTATLEFMEYLNIGIFNFMADKQDDIAPNSWYRKMTPLIPYVRQVGLDIEFKDIAANSLLFRYGLSTDDVDDIVIELQDVAITSAELVLTWVKPRLAIRAAIPPTIKIQSWFVDHKIFDLIDADTLDPVIPFADGTAIVNRTIKIHQVPTYIHIFATVDKDEPETYLCRAVYNDFDGAGDHEVISLDLNSNEPYMKPDDNGITVRINILGGDDVLDENYSALELYRFTVKNSQVNFPWDATKFIGAGADDLEGKFARYKSEFFLILGEDDLNSYYVRKGQSVNQVNLEIRTTLVNADGYGIDKSVANVGDVGGAKKYKLHICFYYDRYYYQLDNCGNVYNGFDAKFI